MRIHRTTSTAPRRHRDIVDAPGVALGHPAHNLGVGEGTPVNLLPLPGEMSDAWYRTKWQRNHPWIPLIHAAVITGCPDAAPSAQVY